MAERSLTRNAADPKAVKDAQRLSSRRRDRFRRDLAAALAYPEMRAVLWGLIGRAGVYESTFHRDPYVMASLAGQQTFGQSILADILDVDPAAYLRMEQEARDRDARDRADEDAAATPSAERKDGPEE